MSEFVRHEPCPECGSSDALAVYDDGHGYCFSVGCGYTTGGGKREDIFPPSEELSTGSVTPVTTVFRDLPRRGLPEEAVRKYLIDVVVDKTSSVVHRYPYFKDGRHVANHVRLRDKKGFPWEYDSKEELQSADLFGQQLFPAGSAAAITVVEGELDAPSAWLMLGSRYPVVSVRSAGSAVEDCRRAYEYLDSFEKIVLCFDRDEPKQRPDGTTFYPGQDAAQKVAELFAPGKCHILTLQNGKDPNEYLQKGIDGKTFRDEWWKAKPYLPDGLVFGHDLWDAIVNSPKPYAVETPFSGLNQKIYGLRLGEMVTFTADPKIGKTSILKAIEYALIMNEELREKNYGIGFMHLEEPKKDLAVGLMGLHVGKRLGLPDVETTEEELRGAFDSVINTGRVVIWDHFGSNSVDAVVSKIRHMAALGCKYIVLDHFSMLASDQTDDERKKLDEIATRLKTLTIELDICLIGVIHQNREGKVRGTAAFEQLSNIVIKLERDKLDKNEWRRNVMVVTVTENRFSGRTGPAAYLFFDDATGRFSELSQQEIDAYEAGTFSDADVPF